MSYKIDLQVIADELEFDLEDVEMIMDSFLENAKINLSSLNEAVKSNNYEDIASRAHAIKGSALNLLLDDIGSIAKELEINAMDKMSIDYLKLCDELRLLIDGIKDEE